MVEKDLYTFRLPVSLIRQIDKLTEDKSDFVTMALQATIRLDVQPAIDVDEETHSHTVDYDDEFRYIDRLKSDLEFWKDKYEVLHVY